MKITFKQNPMTLVGKLIQIGDIVNFKATNPDFSEFKFNELKGIKVISTFPSINTGVCDLQTKEISNLANKYSDITFISISMDLPPAQGAWCAANSIKNLLIVSDYKDREFASKYGLLIDELKLMHRSLIVVNDSNKVIKFISNNEITDAPNFNELKSYLNTLK